MGLPSRKMALVGIGAPRERRVGGSVTGRQAARTLLADLIRRWFPADAIVRMR